MMRWIYCDGNVYKVKNVDGSGGSTNGIGEEEVPGRVGIRETIGAEVQGGMKGGLGVASIYSGYQRNERMCSFVKAR